MGRYSRRVRWRRRHRIIRHSRWNHAIPCAVVNGDAAIRTPVAQKIDPDHLPELIETLPIAMDRHSSKFYTVLRALPTGLPRFELPPGRYKLGSPLTGHYSSFEVLADRTVRDLE